MCLGSIDGSGGSWQELKLDLDERAPRVVYISPWVLLFSEESHSLIIQQDIDQI